MISIYKTLNINLRFYKSRILGIIIDNRFWRTDYNFEELTINIDSRYIVVSYKFFNEKFIRKLSISFVCLCWIYFEALKIRNNSKNNFKKNQLTSAPRCSNSTIHHQTSTASTSGHNHESFYVANRGSSIIYEYLPRTSLLLVYH